MTKPLSTTMWCPAVKVGTRWQLQPWNGSASRRGAKLNFLDCYGESALEREVKFVKVRIQEVQGAGYLPSKRSRG